MKRKVKINKLPKGYMQEGGSVNKTLQPVPREEANLEAEKGEVALLKQGGEPMTYNIGGKRHSEGGTPLNLEPGSRIFSDTKKMKIKDKNILAEFGATKPATPAKLAKKYNVNDYQASLANPFADDIEKNTARMMIDKNEEKLDNLFFVQEAKKGFPQGVPGQQMSQPGMMAKYGAELPKAQWGKLELPYTSGKSFGDAMFGDPTANFPQAPQLPFDTTPYQVTPPTSTETSPGGSPGGSGSGPRRNSSGRVPVYSDEYQQLVRAGQEADYYDITPGATAYEDGEFGTRPIRQARRPDGTFGEVEYTDPLMEDFYRRNPFVLEERPDFDKSSKEDDLWFQRRFEELNKLNSEAEGTPYVPYFIEGDTEGRGFDGKFGEHTFNATMGKTRKPDDSSITVEKEDDSSITTETYTQRDPKPFEQDLRNERLIGRNRMSERLRLPWRGRLRGRTIDPVYQSDVQQQQNILAGLNTASDAVSTFGSNPGAVMSNIARLSGISGTESNKIAAALQKENTGIANSAEQFNAQQQTATDVRNMANAQDLYDNTIKAQEVFDEKMRRYNIMDTAARNATDTNLARIKAMNKLNPMFTINTGEGSQYGDIQFQPGVSAASFDVNARNAAEAQRTRLEAERQRIQNDPAYNGAEEERAKLLRAIDEQMIGLNSKAASTSAQNNALNSYYAGMQGVGFALPGMNQFAMGVNPGYGNPYMNPYGMGMRSPYGFKYGGYYDEE